MRSALIAITVFALVIGARAQSEPLAGATRTPALAEAAASSETAHPQAGTLVVPAGTKIPVAIKHGISTRNARPGDAVYAQTTFPVAIENRLLIPAGTYDQGAISSIKRPGRVKGRAEVLFHFTTLVFPNGYTVSLPGSIEGAPDAEHERIKGPEGTIEHEGEKGKDAATVGKTAATGAAIGAAAGRSVKGAGIGGGAGAATGLAIALLTRGSDVRLPSGTTVEMVLGRAVTLDASRVGR